MSSNPSEDHLAIESALQELAEGGDQESAMRTIARADVLLPQAEAVPEGDAAQGVSLPVLEHSGRQYVPVFTSEARMTELAPQAPAFLTVSAGALGASWPSDELWLAVNPGSDTGATLPPQTVRMLPAFAGPAEG